MRIGFLIVYFWPFSGGAETNCLETAKNLVKQGHEVHVFTTDRKDGKILKKEEIYQGIHIHRCKVLFKYKYYLTFYPSIIKILKYPLDILHVHGFGFVQNDILIPFEKMKGTKLVCVPHGPFMALPKYSFIETLFKKVYLKFLRLNLKLFDAIIEVNPYQKEWMREYRISDKKIKFIPNGVSSSIFKKAKPNKIINKYKLNDKFVISYLGRIQDYKGLDQVIKALPDVRKAKPNITFLCIGDDAGDMNRLKALAKKLNVEKNIIFTGRVNEEEKLSLLDKSEIFIFPSQWEAFGIATLEAMARKNAVIASKTEGGRFLIKQENGFTFDYGDINSLREQLIKLIKDNHLRKKMQNNNEKKAKQFLWENISLKLEKLYSSLINKKKALK